MEDAAQPARMASDQDLRIADVVEREQSRLGRFIRRRVPDTRDAEDILQDVFAALVEANRLLVPIDHVTGWLFQVARNRIADLFRMRRAVAVESEDCEGDEDASMPWEALLPSADAGPDAAYRRGRLLDALEAALAALPPDQRAVFVAHEIEGRSFKDIAAGTGVSVNTLLSRKHYAVRRLRQRLHEIHDEISRDRSSS
jgi:RNA polymerase sigma factor (sigma-70 family)